MILLYCYLNIIQKIYLYKILLVFLILLLNFLNSTESSNNKIKLLWESNDGSIVFKQTLNCNWINLAKKVDSDLFKQLSYDSKYGYLYLLDPNNLFLIILTTNGESFYLSSKSNKLQKYKTGTWNVNTRILKNKLEISKICM